ncbi:MAG: ATP-dependent helicase, partial [Candidatus Woesebacteria bacterium]|nr:ATP-dependent helicase [Candidatus Woesebacteria bacterium]
MKLNKEQLQAVKHEGGPLLIIAGAGTGKTTVITERIKYLITKGFAKAEEILALTFTEKGAAEMEERIDVALPLGYGEMWVSTFHSFCDRILRDNGIDIGLSTNYKLMTTAQSVDLVKKNLFDFNLEYFRPMGNPCKFIDGLLQHFSRLQDESITPKEYLKYADKYINEEILEVTKSKELANAYNEYNELKLQNNVLDFGDLITYVIKLFKDRPNILKKYQEKFKYILVDEFQDTNFAQNELVNLLAKKDRNITIVGDDNQSIYRFRGAAISNIIQFKKTYSDAKIVTLNQNYRSTQKILDSAYKLIKHNDPDTLEYQLGISKKLKAVNSKQLKDIRFIHTQTGQEEAERVAEEILRLNAKDKYKWSDMSILVRANNHADSFIREFERQNIQHQFLGPSKLFEKNEIVDLISYLKVLYNPEDSANLYRLLSSDIFDINSLELIKIATNAKKNSLSIFEVIADNTNPKIINLLKLIDKHLRVINKETAGYILYEYINEVGIYKKILENSEDTKAKNIAKFFDKIKSYEEDLP